MQKKIALVGNPNTGKTTMFNTITKSLEHVGNWHGVTVEYKEKQLKQNNVQFTLTDLPGTYSLSCFSYEECVTRDYLINEKPVVINICDANNLKRNLYLTLQLIEMGLSPIMCINMKNELKFTNTVIDCKMLSELLNVPCFLIDAQNANEVKSVVDFALSYNFNKTVTLEYFTDTLLSKFLDDFKQELPTNIDLTSEFFCAKFLEEDDVFIAKTGLSFHQIERLKKLASQQNLNLEIVASLRYNFIEKIISLTVNKNSKMLYGYSKFDNFILNKWWSILTFIFIMGAIFFLTFSSLGILITNGITHIYNCFIVNPIYSFISSLTTNQFIINFIDDAILGSIGSVVGFTPQIILLFFFLNILEDTGYISRLAFTVDDYFAKFGLTGKSVFTLLMGFGCSATACSTSRTLEDKNGKIKTALISPYMSCTAKLPIYILICSAFFSKYSFLIILSLYCLGIAVALFVSFCFNKTVLKSTEQVFIMEFPPYRLPKMSRLVKLMFSNIKSFLFRIGSLVVTFTGIIWILENCNFALKYLPANSNDVSILQSICEFISPIFEPLGFGGYGVVSALITGIVAKEMIVSTVKVINNVASEDYYLLSLSLLSSSSPINFIPASAISFMVFSLLYFPCIATIGVMKKEIGTKWTVWAVFLEFVIAYIVSFVSYRLALYFELFGAVSFIVSTLVFISIIAICFSLKFKKKTCGLCGFNCAKCDR